MNVRDFGNLECEEKLLRTCLFVEATRNETHGLWERDNSYLDENYTLHFRKNPRNDWQQVGLGHGTEVGTFAEHPVFVSFSWNFINGFPVCFYEPTSLVVNHKMVRDYIDKFGANQALKVGGVGLNRHDDATNAPGSFFRLKDMRVAIEADRSLLYGLWNSPVPCLRHLQDYDWFARV